MAPEFNSYLHSLAKELHLEPGEGHEIVLELETHLEDRAAELESQGVDRDTAFKAAMDELGAPCSVASRMYEVHSPGVWRDVLLSTVPHFLLAALFALHLWSSYFLVGLLLVGITLVTWRNWRAGSPSKWSYSWMGYTLVAPTLSWLFSLGTLAYGGWTLVTTGGLPFNVVLFFLLIGYVPFSMWIVFAVVRKVVRRDWLLASLTALPFPFVTSWVLFLNWQGGLWTNHGERMHDTDTARALVFLALAVTTAVFLKVGPRLIRIGLLTLATAILVIVSAASPPISLSAVAVTLAMVASVVFLLSPAMLESRLDQRQARQMPRGPGSRIAAHWYDNPT